LPVPGDFYNIFRIFRPTPTTTPPFARSGHPQGCAAGKQLEVADPVDAAHFLTSGKAVDKSAPPVKQAAAGEKVHGMTADFHHKAFLYIILHTKDVSQARVWFSTISHLNNDKRL
jgi:hypothetical protein